MIDNKLLLAGLAIGAAYLVMKKKRNPSSPFARQRRIDQQSRSRGRKAGYSTYEERMDLANSTKAGQRRFAKTGGFPYERNRV